MKNVIVSKIVIILSLAILLHKSAHAQQSEFQAADVRSLPQGIYFIKDTKANLYLSGAPDEPAISIVTTTLGDLTSYNDRGTSQWQITPLRNGFYKIHLVGGRLNLAVKKPGKGDPVFVTNSKSTEWEIRYVGKAKYAILLRRSKMCLEGPERKNKDKHRPATRVHLWDYKKLSNPVQVWTIIPTKRFSPIPPVEVK